MVFNKAKNKSADSAQPTKNIPTRTFKEVEASAFSNFADETKQRKLASTVKNKSVKFSSRPKNLRFFSKVSCGCHRHIA